MSPFVSLVISCAILGANLAALFDREAGFGAMVLAGVASGAVFACVIRDTILMWKEMK